MADDPLLNALADFLPVVHGPEDLRQVPDLLSAESEFCLCPRIDATMVAGVFEHGFLPMGGSVYGREFLLIKLHEQRSVLAFADLSISRNFRRRARGLQLRCDAGFERCLEACHAFHADSWLTPNLRDAFRAIHRDGPSQAALHSVELYAGEDLIAGEIGVVCGRIYTSLSGFYYRSGAGKVQLTALGMLLAQAGFAFWDLGMDIDYKRELGAKLITRETFLARFAQHSFGTNRNLPRVVSLDLIPREIGR